MKETITIFCKNTGEHYVAKPGISLLEIQQEFGIKTKYQTVHARVNNKTQFLGYRLYGPKTVEFVDIAESSGMRTYVRSLCFILAKAVSNIYPGREINIEHPVSNGYCGIIHGLDEVPQEMIDNIKKEMHALIEKDLPFVPIEEKTPDVVKLFRDRGFEDKALLLETTRDVYSKYFQLGNYIDYFYGVLVPSSGYISLFDLEPLNDGFFIRIPNKKNPIELAEKVQQDKMHRVFHKHIEFLQVVGLENVGDLNKSIQEGRVSDAIKVAEALQEKIIAQTAEKIAKRFNDGVRIVLISGPSSSGKTTFRKRLEIQLKINLLNPVGISLDDYFVNRVDTPKAPNGEYDYESLYALDLEQFNHDLTGLLAGEEVSMPVYNFTTGAREYNGHKLKVDDKSVLIIEGIHGLNPELTKDIAAESKFLVYVSALTSISLDNHNWIPATDNRLLRRMIRDHKYRNYSAIDTISRWPSVRSGEDKWIFPYQENADVMFNSAMIYELAALRKYAEPILKEVPKDVPEYAEASRLLRFLKYFNYLNDRELPPTSLLREFLGGSSFKY